jgi:hypothetical protein
VPLVLAAVWLLIDRRRKHEALIHEAGRVLASWAVAAILVVYAAEKTFGWQGSGTYLSYGGILPMYGVQTRAFALLSWLGHSAVYENFAATLETLPILFMLSRRLQPWAMLLSLAALVNVFIVNTGHQSNGLSLTPIAMIALPICVLAPHTKRLLQLFSGRTVEPMYMGHLSPPRWWWPATNVLTFVAVPWFVFAGVSVHLSFSAGPYKWASAIGGVYRVDRFSRNGTEERLSAEHPERWMEVAIGRYAQDITYLTVDGKRVDIAINGAYSHPGKLPEDALEYWAGKTSEPEGDLPYAGVSEPLGLEHGAMIVGRYDPEKIKAWKPPPPGNIHYIRSDADEVTLSGVVQGDTIVAQLHRLPLDSMPFFRHRWYPSEWRRDFATWARRHGVLYPQ